MAGAIASRISAVWHSSPRRSFAYAIILLLMTATALFQEQTVEEFVLSAGFILVVCGVTYKSTIILWRNYRYGFFAFAALAATLATLAVRALIGGVSDDLPTMIYGFGVPVFASALGAVALLAFLEERGRAPSALSEKHRSKP